MTQQRTYWSLVKKAHKQTLEKLKLTRDVSPNHFGVTFLSPTSGDSPLSSTFF